MEILSKASQTVRQKPVKIEVDVTYYGVKRHLQKLGLLKKKKTFFIQPMTLGKLYFISEYLLKIKGFSIEKTKFTENSLLTAKEHTETLATAIAICITKRKEPSKKLVDFIIQNFQLNELEHVATIVWDQLNLAGFIRTIVLLRGINILETSPIGQGS